MVGDEPEICLAGSPCGADANNAVRTKEDTDRKAREEAERGLREAENRAETQKRIELAALEQAKLRAAEDAAKSQAMKATATTAANEKALRDKLAAEIADLKAKEDAVAAHVKQVELVRSIQVELQNRRCKPGNPDGKWGPLVRQAAARFMSQAKVNIATNEPTEALLTALRAVPNQFCVQCADDEIQAGNACQQKPASKPVSASSGQQSQGGGSGSKASAGSGGGAKTNPGGSRPGRGGGCDRYMFSGQSCTDGAGRTCVQSGTQRSCQ